MYELNWYPTLITDLSAKEYRYLLTAKSCTCLLPTQRVLIESSENKQCDGLTLDVIDMSLIFSIRIRTITLWVQYRPDTEGFTTE